MDIKTILEIIEKDIQSIQYKSEPKHLYEPIAYTLEKKGKRMRPLLIALVYLLFKNDITKVLPLCKAIEVFHNFTLLHDDIMDKASLRRGKPTVYKKWNENVAILSGDVMLVQSYQYLQQLKTSKLSVLLNIFNKGAIKVCEGQQFDMNFENQDTIIVADYIEMIYLKTAALLDNSIEMTAILADASKNDITHLKDFARNIGISFQLKDDLLDVFGDVNKFGKQIGGDILANKKTFLLLKALELASKEQKKKITFWLSTTDHSEEKVKEIIHIYNELNISEITNNLIYQYFEKGMQSFQKVSSQKEEKQHIIDYIENLMKRER